MLIDLQIHSTYSDGFLTPTEAADYLASQGVKIASLTDHNTLGGNEEFKRACQKKKIKAINGLELYVKLNKKRLNILWYNYNDDAALHSLLRDSQIRRKNKVRKMLKKLAEIKKITLDIEKTLDKYTHYVPINGIIRDILANPKNKKIIKKEVPSLREGEIIKEFFRNKEIGILEESYIDIKRIMKIKKKVGGQIILNHPGKHGNIKKNHLESLKKIKMDGLELLSPHHPISAIYYFQSIADEFGWITTGGSDFHLFGGEKNKINHSWEYFKIDSKKLNRIEEIIS